MAIARKCDRCGQNYDENKKYRYNLVMGTVIGLRFETLEGFNSSRIDLCDECFGKIKNFLGTDILTDRE